MMFNLNAPVMNYWGVEPALPHQPPAGLSTEQRVVWRKERAATSAEFARLTRGLKLRGHASQAEAEAVAATIHANVPPRVFQYSPL